MDKWLDAQHTARPGDIIERTYQIIRVIGTGSSSTVYLVRHMMMERLSALKMLKADVSPDNLATKRFEREAQAVSKLAHPHLVTLYDFGKAESGHLYFVMELLQGKTLGSLIVQEGRLGSERACRIFLQVADAMAHAHNAGVIHRDLKPGNIVVTKAENGDEFAKVVDFGVAKITEMESKDLKLTQEGQTVGSPAYMSPEQCQGLELDNRSDIYSLGCVMYETLSGSRPFVAGHALAVFVKHVTDEAPPMMTVNPDLIIHPALEKGRGKVHEKVPSERYQSMLDLVDDLECIYFG